MRITHRILAQSVTRNLQHNLRSLNRRSNQLSTGRLFSRPSEDPAGTYKVMKLSGTGLARNTQYLRNIGEGLSWLTMTDDTLAEAIDVVHRLRELAVYSANSIHSPEDRRAMVPEVRQLLEQLIGIGNTELAGLYIFGGHQTEEKPYKIAGSKGEILQPPWFNKNSGLVAGQNGIGIGLNNLASGTYAVSTGVESISAATSGVAAAAAITAEYLSGEREGFFGTKNITFTLNSLKDTNGSVALEVLDATRYQDLTDAQKAAVGPGEENDRIIRLGVRYYLYDLNGNPQEGSYGFENKVEEEIYLNLNRLHLGDQIISFTVGPSGEKLELAIAAPEALTFEHDIPLAGDKLVLQLTPLFPAADGTYDRFTFHKNYGAADENGRSSTGIRLDWYFYDGKLDPEPPQTTKTTTLKFFDIDSITGELITCAIEPEFSKFGSADGKDTYWDMDSLHGQVADEELADRPAAIFTYISPGVPYYVGDSFNRMVEFSPQLTVPTSITGIEAFGENEIFQSVLRMEKALLHNNQFALGGSVLEDLEKNLDRLLKCRSEVGARMERLLTTEGSIESEQIYLKELRSKVEDIDMAEAITEFMMQENAYQAALATGARIVYPSLIDFLR